jgi:hypothetical protein
LISRCSINVFDFLFLSSIQNSSIASVIQLDDILIISESDHPEMAPLSSRAMAFT